jgi:hypothetical protein
MGIPKRIKNYTGRFALVDSIPFTMPVQCRHSPALMAGFFCDYSKARELLPGNQLHPFKYLNGKAVFMVTVWHSRAHEEQNRHPQCFLLYL